MNWRQEILNLSNFERIGRPYQDIVLNGELLRDGQRQCQERLDMILDVLPENATVLDVGSYSGYFCTELAMRRPDVLAVGIESYGPRIELAARICEAQGLRNCIMLNSSLDLKVLRMLWNSCEMFDYTFLLSVLHHIPKNDVVEFLELLRCTSFNFIIELASSGETEACGNNSRELISNPDVFLPIHFSDCKIDKVGEVDSHTMENMKRPVYHIQDGSKVRFFNKPYMLKVDKPNVHTSKNPLDIVLSGPEGFRRYNLDATDPQKQMLIKSHQPTHRWLPGVNLHTMLNLGMMWPKRADLEREATKILKKERPFDAATWNMIITAEGLKTIDLEDFAALKYKDRYLDRTQESILNDGV